ncbi:uncharacterized protein LOC128092715 [Culex pipiens pallens]|uniref:uncharacterized protein LOC128092715 n=1 Tax=Culex pipiens pallens TaxID=42434 RepID=UPI0022AA7C16|nr:uncharacterized protein LOC128092715 [Culex pipiens pallens]
MPPAPRGTDDGYSFRPHSSSSVGQGDAELKPGTVSSERSFSPLSYTVTTIVTALLQSERIKPLSPYFNIDADLLDDNPALPTIIPRQRGRLERAFPLIGASFLVGFVTGGLTGIIEGIGSTRFMDGTIRRSQ